MTQPEKDSKPRSPLKVLFRRIFPSIGVVGLLITVAMNLVALFVFRKAQAEFFSRGWWTSWFVSYLVWLVFTVIGVAGIFMKRE